MDSPPHPSAVCAHSQQPAACPAACSSPHHPYAWRCLTHPPLVAPLHRAALAGIYDPNFIAANQEARADNIIKGSRSEQLAAVRGHIREFKAASGVDKVGARHVCARRRPAKQPAQQPTVWQRGPAGGVRAWLGASVGLPPPSKAAPGLRAPRTRPFPVPRSPRLRTLPPPAQVVVLWTANTERFAQLAEGLNDTADNLLAAIEADEAEIAPSTLYAAACVLEGVPFVNGSPQNTFVPGLIELAVQRGVLIGGDDFKSGQTKMKSVLVDFLVGAGLKPTSIVSYNHLGNNDGMNLSAPQTFRSKEISKSNVVDDMVASNALLYGPGEHPGACAPRRRDRCRCAGQQRGARAAAQRQPARHALLRRATKLLRCPGRYRAAPPACSAAPARAHPFATPVTRHPAAARQTTWW